MDGLSLNDCFCVRSEQALWPLFTKLQELGLLSRTGAGARNSDESQRGVGDNSHNYSSVTMCDLKAIVI